MKGVLIGVAVAFATSAGAAWADDYDILRSECGKQLQLSSSGCDCVVAKAKLNDKERALVVAHVTQDQNAIMQRQQGMSGDSVMKAVMFMAQTPQKCAGQ